LRAVADLLQLPSIAIRLTRHQVNDGDDGRAGEPLDPALYPIPPWKPSAKSGIDRALLYAIMRQESDFNAFAHSPVGALGLMQIMPDTARMLNRGRRPFRGTRRLDKYDPKIIINFGQRYLTHLRSHKRVRNDLLRVIAAYNSGPGNIGYWARKRIKHQKDPLLFIEAIPNLETRLFVRRVLANLWIYRHRLDQGAPSLKAISAGRFPRYRPIDGKNARRTAVEITGRSDG
jgi:soluble lytic murein transglycosylase-like protein